MRVRWGTFLGCGTIGMTVLLFLSGCESTQTRATPEITVGDDLPWSQLAPKLCEFADGEVESVRVNGALFHFPDTIFQSSKTKPRWERKEPPMRVGRNGSLEKVDRWLRKFSLPGALVMVSPDVPAGRVTRLAKLFEAHRITAVWSGTGPGQYEFEIYETTSGMIVPMDLPHR